jgi:hypothetical protein
MLLGKAPPGRARRVAWACAWPWSQELGRSGGETSRSEVFVSYSLCDRQTDHTGTGGEI